MQPQWVGHQAWRSCPQRPGIIDSDYRGSIGVILHNAGAHDVIFRAGDRIAQLLIVPIYGLTWIKATQFEETERGAGGFGSTGA